MWFGNSLVLAAVTIPALNRLPLVRQQEVGAQLGERGVRVFDVVGPAVIVLGFLRGTVFGQIEDAEALFGTTYGLTFLLALIVAIATFLWGAVHHRPRHANARYGPRGSGWLADTGARRGAGAGEARDRARADRFLRHLHVHDPDALRAGEHMGSSR